MHGCCTDVNRWIRNTQSLSQNENVKRFQGTFFSCSHVKWTVQVQLEGATVPSASSVKNSKCLGKQCFLGDVVFKEH